MGGASAKAKVEKETSRYQISLICKARGGVFVGRSDQVEREGIKEKYGKMSA